MNCMEIKFNQVYPLQSDIRKNIYAYVAKLKAEFTKTWSLDESCDLVAYETFASVRTLHVRRHPFVVERCTVDIVLYRRPWAKLLRTSSYIDDLEPKKSLPIVAVQRTSSDRRP